MNRTFRFFLIALLGVTLVVVITRAIEQPGRISVVADLPSDAGQLDLSYLTDLSEPGEELSGGATTVRDTGVHAFGRVPMNLTSFDTNWIYFREGRKVFERDWFAIRGGRLLLGPQYNATSCMSCHKLDGRGRPPLGPDEEPESIVMRLSVPHGNGTQPEPKYGYQLSYYAVDSVIPEGKVRISYDEIEGHFADGSRYTLRVPSYDIDNLGYGSLASDVQVSPRVAPANFGLGLLEAIPEQAILALADPDDHDKNGISGRPNYVHDNKSGKNVLGRFGWKANQPTIEQQIHQAFNMDIGITTPDATYNDRASYGAASAANAPPELQQKEFDPLLYYMKMIAVPQRRNWQDPTVRRGQRIFHNVGCAGCHTPSFTTGDAGGYAELAHQTIRPYTDMLLHDMGEGLADNRPDGLANGQEWRTPPLWGIGLVKTVSKHTFFMHDGRARNMEEAVLWHGGEAAAAQNLYRRLRREDRAALITFLESL